MRLIVKKKHLLDTHKDKNKEKLKLTKYLNKTLKFSFKLLFVKRFFSRISELLVSLRFLKKSFSYKNVFYNEVFGMFVSLKQI